MSINPDANIDAVIDAPVVPEPAPEPTYQTPIDRPQATTRPLISILRCPGCGSEMKTSIMTVVDHEEFGILTCRCSEYPLLAGIPVIKQGLIGPLGESADEIINLIRRREYRKALLILSRPSSDYFSQYTGGKRRIARIIGTRRYNKLVTRMAARRWDKKAEPLLKNSLRVTADQLVGLYFNEQQRDYYDYFRYRFSQPRHLVALSLAGIIPASSKPVLDLGCGFGQVTRGIYHQTNGNVIGIDNLFFLLLTAKRAIAPRADYVCCDANTALPFADDAFSAAFSSNVFHFIEQKSLCLSELERITDRKLIILPSLRHSDVNCKTPNTALSIEAYQQLMSNMSCRIINDQDTLARYLLKKGPALEKSAELDLLRDVPFITVVASKDEDLFRDHGDLQEWSHAKGHLGINPLYQAGPPLNNYMRLTLKMPSQHWKEDNHECEVYLPAEVNIRMEVLDDLAAGRRTPEIETLIEQFVVMDIPTRYG